MSKLDVREFFKCFRHHAGIILKGFIRTLCGVAVAGLAALAVYGFVKIPTEDGYIAVCDFACSLATLAVAVSGMYDMGTCRKKGAKR